MVKGWSDRVIENFSNVRFYKDEFSTDTYIISILVPGVSKFDIDLTLNGDESLTVFCHEPRASDNDLVRDIKKNLNFTIPLGFEPSGWAAKLSNGVLEIWLDNMSSRKKKIAINVPPPSELLHPMLLNENSDF